jgi:hypothetical protein
MVVQPHQVHRNKDSGYILSNASLVLRDNYTDDDICLDHINRTNAIAFSINTHVVDKVKNSWKNLDRQKAGETADGGGIDRTLIVNGEFEAGEVSVYAGTCGD